MFMHSQMELPDAFINLIPATRLWMNPGCGLKTRNREETVQALENMAQAAKNIRSNRDVSPGRVSARRREECLPNAGKGVFPAPGKAGSTVPAAAKQPSASCALAKKRAPTRLPRSRRPAIEAVKMQNSYKGGAERIQKQHEAGNCRSKRRFFHVLFILQSNIRNKRGKKPFHLYLVYKIYEKNEKNIGNRGRGNDWLKPCQAPFTKRL
jgi:hypothetical protein